jgi:hypothetical protein
MHMFAGMSALAFICTCVAHIVLAVAELIMMCLVAAAAVEVLEPHAQP